MVRRVMLSACSVLLLCTNMEAQERRPELDAAVVLDRYMSPAAGTRDLLAVQQALAAIEDRVLPLKFGDETSRPRLLVGILYRAGKLVGLDVPQDHMLLVIGHEVFGHGARLRELGTGRIAYSFDPPLPYGDGGAVTSFDGDFPDTPLAFLAIESAGIEAQNVMADAIAETALAHGRLHYRDAWLYFETRYLGMTYILSATDRSAGGHDVADFLRTFRDACTTPACTPISSKAAKHGARFTLADPLLYYSLYGFGRSYIAEGKSTTPLPMIPIGGTTQYLPSLGFALAPYGTEYVVRNMVVTRHSATEPGKDHGGEPVITTVAVRVGTTGAGKTWAIDARRPDLGEFRGVHIGVAADLWRQPPLLADQSSAPLRTGAAASITAILPLRRLPGSGWLKATVSAGYKSEGYVPGEQLGGGMVFRAGVSIASRSQ